MVRLAVRVGRRAGVLGLRGGERTCSSLSSPRLRLRVAVPVPISLCYTCTPSHSTPLSTLHAQTRSSASHLSPLVSRPASSLSVSRLHSHLYAPVSPISPVTSSESCSHLLLSILPSSLRCAVCGLRPWCATIVGHCWRRLLYGIVSFGAVRCPETVRKTKNPRLTTHSSRLTLLTSV